MTGQMRKVSSDLTKFNPTENEEDKYSHHVMQSKIIEEENEDDNFENKSKKFCSENELNSNIASISTESKISNDEFKQPQVRNIFN